MEALVAVFLGLIDIIATFDNCHGWLTNDGFCDSLDIVSKWCDDTNTGDVADILFDAVNSKLVVLALTFFDDRIERFDSVFDRIKGRAFAAHLCFLP